MCAEQVFGVRRRHDVKPTLYQKCIDDKRFELLTEWDSQKNNPLTPWTVTPGSHRRVWWKCQEGHEWQTAVYTRWAGHGCPYCKGHVVIPGVNDLAARSPALATEWHPVKNGNIKPEDVLSNSGKAVWWRCEKGHEWQAPVNDRTNGGGCPYCNSRRLLPGFNDLATTNPELAKEWHPTKNGELTPDQIFPGSKRRVWWQCEKGHEWQATVFSRAKTGCGCPVCAGKSVLPGYNDLAAIAPKIAAQWHPTKNSGLTPDMVYHNSTRRVWWQCEKGHEWKATILSRVRQKAGCPVCANKTVLVEVNDLATVAPALAAQWHPTKNGSLTPYQVGAGSHLRVWWICEKGHEWRAQILSRISTHCGCPVCTGRIVVSGDNDLATFAPAIAAEWHPTKNNGLAPDCVRPQSNRVVWWRCKKGHDWRAPVKSRVDRSSGCPYCTNRRLLVGFNDLATTEPLIAAQWDAELNGRITPEMVMAGSHKKAWWRCPEGHVWQALVYSRTGKQKSGCPICAGTVGEKRLMRMRELEESTRRVILSEN